MSLFTVEGTTLPLIDLKIVTEARQGDRAARDRLLEEAYRRVFRYELRLTRGNADEAHELAQETIYRVLRSLRSLRSPDRFVPWLLRIAANVWRDRIAKANPALSEDPPAACEEEDDRPDRIAHALESLEEPYRSAVTLRYIEGLDYEAMSEALGVSAVTLRSHVARGLRMIRQRCVP